MAQEKQGWDTRAWLVGILGGMVGGSVMAWVSYPPFMRRINAATNFGSAADWLLGVSLFLSTLVLPGVLSGIARRRTFLWGLLPLTLSLAVVDLKNWIVLGPRHVATTFWMSLLAIGFCLLVSSGPVSLFRYGRARARRRREAALAAFAAQREAASIPQEGVWPPPPDYRPQD